MLETLGNIGEFLGSLAVVASLVYVGFQLRQTQKQMHANSLQQRISTRIQIWSDQLEKEALHSAQDKFFEHELYKRDLLLPEIEELTLRERRAIERAFSIEILYFENLFYQRQHGMISSEEAKPLNYMLCLREAPQRRFWKDTIRINDHLPFDFIVHVDDIVKKYDQVERIMDENEDSDYESVVMDVFNVPAAPPWV